MIKWLMVYWLKTGENFAAHGKEGRPCFESQGGVLNPLQNFRNGDPYCAGFIFIQVYIGGFKAISPNFYDLFFFAVDFYH